MRDTSALVEKAQKFLDSVFYSSTVPLVAIDRFNVRERVGVE